MIKVNNFQNAVQNHYLSFGFSSPMIFLGSKFWSADIPIYPLLQGLMRLFHFPTKIMIERGPRRISC